MTPDSATWQILVPMGFLGLGMAGVWAPLAATATRNLPMHLAGAGAGVYNATRNVGSVLGSAAIAVLMDSRLAAQGLSSGGSSPESAGGGLPAAIHEAFSTAMSQSMLLSVGVLVLGLLSCLFFVLPQHLGGVGYPTRAGSEPETAPAA